MLRLGDWFVVDHKLRRRVRDNDAMWVPLKFNKPVEVMFVGKRTLANGKVFYSNEDGPEFVRKESVKAWLVVANEREKPFYVNATDEVTRA